MLSFLILICQIQVGETRFEELEELEEYHRDELEDLDEGKEIEFEDLTDQLNNLTTDNNCLRSCIDKMTVTSKKNLTRLNSITRSKSLTSRRNL